MKFCFQKLQKVSKKFNFCERKKSKNTVSPGTVWFCIISVGIELVLMFEAKFFESFHSIELEKYTMEGLHNTVQGM